MTPLDTLYEVLHQAANDWQAREILADWFEEAAQQACADCVRWMVKQHKRPYRSITGTYHWFNAQRVTTASDPESNIPEAIYRHLQGKEGLAMFFRDYPSLRQAEEDFYRAWQQAREQGWSSHDGR
jgi:hypothetical protein